MFILLQYRRRSYASANELGREVIQPIISLDNEVMADQSVETEALCFAPPLVVISQEVYVIEWFPTRTAILSKPYQPPCRDLSLAVVERVP
jgi:hypothetical protein